jgi:hypothetical protein
MQTAHVIVTVEYTDGSVRYRAFSREGCAKSLIRSVRRILARESSVVHVEFGDCWYTNSYGAH